MAGKNEKNGGKVERKALEAPKNLSEAISMLTDAIVLLHSEKGTWHFFDLPRAILHAVTDKGKKTVARECSERSDCVELSAPEIMKELHELKSLLTRTMVFSSKKLFRAFLCSGFDKEDVLLRKRTARILKPAFTVIRDKESKCLIVFIRGTHSLRDTLTDALCAPISFDHFIYSDGRDQRRNNVNVVSGHAHRGMVAAASWVKKRCVPILLDALQQFPDFKIKIVGHSLGGGTAALLTFKLREIQQFSSSTCVTFGPAACVTLELAEFGKPFIVSVINGYDIVPTLSASSVHDFISEGGTKDKNIPNTTRSSITAIGSHLPLAKAIAEHVVTRSNEVVKKHRHATRSLLHWSRSEASESSETSCESHSTEEHWITEYMLDDEEYNFSSEVSDNDDSDDDEDELLNQTDKLKLQKQDNIPNIKEKEAATTKLNITEEEGACHVTKSSRHHLYPPGRIMHIVPSHSSENSKSNRNDHDEKRFYLYETPRQLYGKLRLSKGMILDHPTKKYLKMLQQLINQLEKEQLKYRGG